MIEVINPQDCCGCTACASICPTNAITMEPDALGFLYPKINTKLCINCNACEKVCAFNDHYDTHLNLSVPIVYGARHKNIHEIETSRSGAAFIAISDVILQEGGVVYGAGYAEHFRVVHKRATTKSERDEFKGSKYVQSDLKNVFKQIKIDLKNGVTVLFSGTPCQTAGLNSFIGKKYSKKLYLIDIVCHGVPSPYIWRDYLAYKEKKNGLTFTEVNFRDKTQFGWASHSESFKGKNFYKHFSSYSYLFCSCIMFRHSCEICHYTNLRRPSDITLADFWGWQKTDKNFNKDNKGCSLVFCNTQKGVNLFNSSCANLSTIPVNIENCLQPNLQHPTTSNPHRGQFEKDYVKHGFKYIIRKYGDINIRHKIARIKNRILNTLRRFF